MRYRIEYADGRCCNFANSRKDLLDWVTDSVIDSYRSYLKQ